MTPIYHIPYREWMTLQTQLLWCYDQPVNGSGRKHANHVSHFNAWLVRKGTCVVNAQGQAHHAHAGEWMIPSPGKRTQFFTAGTHILSVAFHCQWPTGEPVFHNGLGLIVKSTDFPKLEKTASKLDRTIQACLPEGNWRIMRESLSLTEFLKIDRALLNWIDAFSQALLTKGQEPTHLGEVDDRILNAMQMLQNMSMDASLNVDTLAEQVGLSRTQLERLYRKYMRCTPRQHFERLRLDFARNRLLMPDARIKEIALELGFEYLAHFSRWFKRLQGCSPRIFKKGESLQ